MTDFLHPWPPPSIRGPFAEGTVTVSCFGAALFGVIVIVLLHESPRVTWRWLAKERGPRRPVPQRTRALAVIRYAKVHGTPHRPWLTALLARRPTKVAAIALANKIARMAWAMMARGERYKEPIALAA
jgi:hypothetical protein